MAKLLQFVGSALKDLRAFPLAARREAGYQLDRVQHGLDPSDGKPVPGIGSGVREIRIHVEGEHRLIYMAKHADFIYVLHAFRKKTRKTRTQDLELARKRLRSINVSHP